MFPLSGRIPAPPPSGSYPARWRGHGNCFAELQIGNDTVYCVSLLCVVSRHKLALVRYHTRGDQSGWQPGP